MRTKGIRLIDVLMPRTRQSILGATLMQPERAWFAAELARHLGTTRSSLQRELVKLVKVGILKSRREGRMLYVQADRECPVFLELQGLLSKTAGLVDLLRDALLPFGSRIVCSFVFGSVARAEEVSASDVDLFIVGDVGLRDVAATLLEARRKTGREVNAKLYRSEDLVKRLTARDHFVINVLSTPKLFVIGSQHDLDRITEGKSSLRRTVEQS